jgi:hypothetical protein
MATFKVGQRVRILKWWHGEGTIMRRPDPDFWAVLSDTKGREVGFLDCELAPLTDPKADEFIERVKKWKPEPEIVAPKHVTTYSDLVNEVLRQLRTP